MTTTILLGLMARRAYKFVPPAMAGAVALGAGLHASLSHAADDYPNQPVRYLLHVSPGGGTDVLARQMASELEQILGQPFVVENRPGGQTGVQLAAITSAASDGYTIGSTTATHIAVMNAVFDEYSIDSVDWIAGLVTDPPVLVVHDSVPFDSLEGLVEEVKANPGQYSVSGTVDGSTGHIAWAMFAEAAGITEDEVRYVPYDSQGDSVTANVGGHIPIGMAWTGITRDHVEAGNLRVLGVLSEERVSAFPDTPTFTEAGYEVDPSWQQFRGIIGPKGIPDDVKAKLVGALEQVTQTEDYKEYIESSNLNNRFMGPEEFTEFVARQNEIVAEWVERLGLDE
ncbi:tripartite tricarboxylate transporter substrate binding protein [Halomonas daqingensis]|uniref:Tripartite tricarboxylate transporter substrate binding protein n=1 Tax=Billgrantia desiderata TaxID=52021 RepID=A0ABS9B4I8_9GAMM|nr:tripartite tricarboxylate transporter substrate binding protein [Halomonas desiderata]MCE8042320.1 tripartite tricarboxylate transporter substrate binding protein [Halomonas desiderata]MCE8046895.1 tripartite tricarboxylate transporter substrate binding protein [Halomonas desiderata]